MAVFLGSSGSFELQRTSIDDAYTSEVEESDVNPDKNRFSFDYPTGQYLTGDLLEITTTDETDLDFIDSSGWADEDEAPYDNGEWYIHVDQVGGVTLYKKFDDAVSGEENGRVELNSIDRTIPISVEVRNNDRRLVAQVTDYEINTQRDAVDVTELGESFRQQFSGLISGSGTLTCFFDYEDRICDDGIPAGSEIPVYLNQLILRSEIGSEFIARLYLIRSGQKPLGNAGDKDDSVWYDIEGLITNVAMAFEPTQPIRVVVSYVTTGEIKLKTQTFYESLGLEQGGAVELEQDEDGTLALEDAS